MQRGFIGNVTSLIIVYATTKTSTRRRHIYEIIPYERGWSPIRESGVGKSNSRDFFQVGTPFRGVPLILSPRYAHKRSRTSRRDVPTWVDGPRRARLPVVQRAATISHAHSCAGTSAHRGPGLPRLSVRFFRIGRASPAQTAGLPVWRVSFPRQASFALAG